MADTTVTVTIGDPKGLIIATYTGNTGADGTFTASHRVANKSTSGIYTIKATAIKGNPAPVEEAVVTFEVTGR